MRLEETTSEKKKKSVLRGQHAEISSSIAWFMFLFFFLTLEAKYKIRAATCGTMFQWWPAEHVPSLSLSGLWGVNLKPCRAVCRSLMAAGALSLTAWSTCSSLEILVLHVVLYREQNPPPRLNVWSQPFKNTLPQVAVSDITSVNYSLHKLQLRCEWTIRLM